MKYKLLISSILLFLSCSDSDIFIVDIKYSSTALWYVHPDSALNSIQEALDRCVNYDTVLVAAGTYYENLIWPNTQGIYLVSESGPDLTIIDGSDSGRVITISEKADSFTVIRGFTVQNGWLEWSGGLEEYGAGIFCDSFASPVIMGNIIKSNYSTLGGSGIGCIKSSAIIDHNIISENACGGVLRGGMGAGILCAYGGSPVIYGNRIMYNTCGGMYSCKGAGIAFAECSAYLVHNTIEYNGNNSNAGAGGGIYCNSSTLSLIENAICNNSSVLGYGGGVACYNSSVILEYCFIYSNAAWWHSGGIYCNNSSLVARWCYVGDNDPEGIYIYSLSDPVIVNYTNISGNTGYGLRNDVASYMVNAEYNWWGDPSGPGGAGPGSGDSVSQYVDFDPWLTEPILHSSTLNTRN